MIKKLVAAVEKVSFGCDFSAESVGDLVTWILQDREAQFVFLGMSLNCGRVSGIRPVFPILTSTTFAFGAMLL